MSTLYGLLGQSLKHSISPMIHQAIFDISKVPAHYHLFEVEKNKLKDSVTGLKALGAVGVNVTIPYKIEVMQYLDSISPEAMAIGSVNSIAFRDNAAIGYNTDYFGFGMLLERYDIKTKGMKALVLGYGGAAKAIIRFLLDHGIDNITVAVRNTIDSSLNVSASESDKVTIVDYKQLLLQNDGDLIINCTPCGMYPKVEEAPVSADIIQKYHTAVDIIYNPLETLFLKRAKDAGLKNVNGLYMLVSQAVAAQEIWSGVHLSQVEVEKIYNIVVEYMLEKKV